MEIRLDHATRVQLKRMLEGAPRRHHMHLTANAVTDVLQRLKVTSKGHSSGWRVRVSRYYALEEFPSPVQITLREPAPRHERGEHA